MKYLKFLFLFFTISLLFFACNKNNNFKEDKLITKLYPSDYFYNIRAYPFNKLDLDAYKTALKNVNEIKQNLNNNNLRTLNENWQLLGPKNIGGRINSIAVPQNNDSIIYVGCAKGGIFKTEDAGNNWFPIFDEQSYLSIGDVAIDPNNSNIIFAGTGDVNISGSHYIGDGIYKSEDAGNTWTNTGLQETGVVAEVIIHPQNSNTIYAATMGFPQIKDANRGLYKSTNGGQNWTNILYINDSTGIADIVTDPNNENIIYAATWVRYRTITTSIIAGNSAKIYKTIDGGNTWNILENGLPYDSYNLIEDTLGRIGITIDPNNTNVLYAQIQSRSSQVFGIYKTTDAGNTWTEIANSPSTASFSWYFAKLRLNPYAPTNIFSLDVQLWKTDNDTVWDQNDPNWFTYEVHADKHDIYFYDANSYLLATDGGLYKTVDAGNTWQDVEDIPNSQFYHAKVNPHILNDYWGGMQDNGTSHGNENDCNNWPRTFGGDGFNVEFNKDNADVVYVETQRGNVNVSSNGGNSFSDADDGIDGNDRTNWNTPFIVSNHNSNIMYRGTYRLYKSDAGIIPYWEAVSGDLTNGVSEGNLLPTIFDINESAVDENIIYVGTTDGLLHISEDAGYSFTNISNGLPNFHLTDVEAGNNVNNVFVTHSGYFSNNYIPHVNASFNKGLTWQDISGNLPQIGVNDFEQHPKMDSLFFVATDGGVFYSEDFGNEWQILGNNLPTVNVSDVEIDTFQNKLIAGTFARSMWSIDITELLSEDFQNIVLQTNGNQTICENDSVQLFVEGANFYSWNNDAFLSCNNCPNPIATVNQTTTFEVTACLTATNCITEQTVVAVIETPQTPTIFYDTLSNTITVNNFGNFGFWYINDVSINNLTSNQIEITDNGTYFFESFNDANCNSVFSDTVSIIFTNINEYNFANVFIFPNPVNNILKINTSTNFDEILIYDIAGKIVLQQKFNENINVAFLTKGNYLLHLLKDGKLKVKEQFIKN